MAKQWTKEEEDQKKWGKFPISRLIREDGVYEFWATKPYLDKDKNNANWRIVFKPVGTESTISMSLDSNSALENLPPQLALDHVDKAFKYIDADGHNEWDKAAYRFLAIVGWKGSTGRKKIDTRFLKTYRKLCAHRYIETLLSSSSFIDKGQPLKNWNDYKKTLKYWLDH